MHNIKYDYLIVGSGLFGATFARMATDQGKRCLVLEKRPHAGGNIYCEKIAGVNVHKYGAHIFHTSDKRVWDFVNRIVPFNRYTNSPVAIAPNGKLYNLPFNMNTFYSMWGIQTPSEVISKLEAQRREALERMKNDGINEARNLEEQAMLLIGKDIYELLIKGYTEKQWGRPCSELPPFIIRRLPVRLTFDNNYFNDLYQGIPVGGYNILIDGLLNGIDVQLNTDFFDRRDYWTSVADKIVFTGKIDEFYDYCYGKLEYRSVYFETKILEEPNHQGNAVVNYTSADVPFTRIIEHKHFESFGETIYDNPQTVVSYEYPSEWNDNIEPFYPINNDKNQKLYMKYQALAASDQKVIFGGRLAEYRYYDMAPIIAKVLEYFD